MMTFMGWVALGLVAGFLVNSIVFRKGEDRQLDVLLAVVGAVIGGLIFKKFGTTPETGFAMWSAIDTVIGAIAILFAWRIVRSSMSRA